MSLIRVIIYIIPVLFRVMNQHPIALCQSRLVRYHYLYTIPLSPNRVVASMFFFPPYYTLLSIVINYKIINFPWNSLIPIFPFKLLPSRTGGIYSIPLCISLAGASEIQRVPCVPIKLRHISMFFESFWSTFLVGWWISTNREL